MADDAKPSFQMQPVKSSNIDSVGYDPATQELHVLFTGGSRYRYSGVPPDAHEAFMGSASKGGHFAANIRGKFAHVKV